MAPKSQSRNKNSKVVDQPTNGSETIGETQKPIVSPKTVASQKEDKMSEDMPSIIEFSSDIDSAEAPDPLPTGTYTGVVRMAEAKTSARDTKYAAVTFHISPDQYPPDFTDGNPDGTTLVFRRVPLEDNVQSRYTLKRFLEAIGAPRGKRIDLTEWVGCEGKLEITHESYEGVNRATIKAVSSL